MRPENNGVGNERRFEPIEKENSNAAPKVLASTSGIVTKKPQNQAENIRQHNLLPNQPISPLAEQNRRNVPNLLPILTAVPTGKMTLAAFALYHQKRLQETVSKK